MNLKRKRDEVNRDQLRYTNDEDDFSVITSPTSFSTAADGDT